MDRSFTALCSLGTFLVILHILACFSPFILTIVFPLGWCLADTFSICCNYAWFESHWPLFLHTIWLCFFQNLTIHHCIIYVIITHEWLAIFPWNSFTLFGQLFLHVWSFTWFNICVLYFYSLKDLACFLFWMFSCTYNF